MRLIISVKFIGILCILWASQACKKQNSQEIREETGIVERETTIISISTEETFYDSVMGNSSDTEYVVLQENDDTMFSEIGKIVCHGNKYYILDRVGSYTAVSFNHDGTPNAVYGRRGNGPGEYVFPWDIDIDDNYVYILDENHKKLILYSHTGQFIRERKIPFMANGFSLLGKNKYIFSIEPSKKKQNQICITDTAISDLKYCLKRPEKFVGGWVTPNVFRKIENGVTYYQSPTDYIYSFNEEGELSSILKLDFQDKGVPELAKQDFVEAFSKDILRNKLFITDNPIVMKDGKLISQIDANKGIYTVVTDSKTKLCGAKCLDNEISVCDIIEPKTCDDTNRVVCVLDQTILDNCIDLDKLPDNIISALKNGNRVLMLKNI